MWPFRRRPTPDVIAVPTGTRETVVLTARIRHAGRICRRTLTAQSLLEREARDEQLVDVLCEVLVALDLAPKAGPEPSVPVIPGRSS